MKKNYTVQPKYIQFLFVNYTSIKWGGGRTEMRKVWGVIPLLQL